MLEIHCTGKTTKKRQNFDFSTPPACTEHLHFTLKEETRRALHHHQTLAPRRLGKTWTTR
jgi:hypothetical protein